MAGLAVVPKPRSSGEELEWWEIVVMIDYSGDKSQYPSAGNTGMPVTHQ